MTTKADIIRIAQQDMNAALVTINTAAIDALDRAQFVGGGVTNLTEGTQTMSLEEGIRYAIALNSINYRFWDLRNGDMVRYQHEGKVGALAMTAAFEKAWKREVNPFSSLTKGLAAEDIQAVFGDMPDVATRITILNEVLLSPALREVSEQLADAIANSHGTFVLGTQHAQQLADAFPQAYADPLLKKAQLAISAVWIACKERGFDVVTDLTAFADYQIPRILRALNILQYAPALAQKIDNMQVIVASGDEERALRAASILAIEQLSEKHGVSSAAIDHFLWTRRNEAKEPFHLCETTLY